MERLLTPISRRRASEGYRNTHSISNHTRVPRGIVLSALLITLVAAACFALAIPGGASTTAKDSPRTSAPTATGAATIAPSVPAPASAFAGSLFRRADAASPNSWSPAASAFAAPFFQAAPLATYAADCTTPQTSFNLGNDVCVKTSGVDTTPLRRVVLASPANVTFDSINVNTADQTTTFTLPSTTSTGGFDNRGTWIVGLVNTSDGNLEGAVLIQVRDTARPAADLTISKINLGSLMPVAGTDVTYQIYIWNRGPDAATNASFSDNTLPNTTFVSLTQDSGPAFNCTSPAAGTAGTSTCKRGTATAPLTFNRGDVASFTAVYHVSTSIGNNTELTDTATITSDTEDQAASSNSSDVTATASNPTPPACTISCPANRTVTAATGQTGAVVTFNDPVATGSCGSAPVSVVPASDSFFAIGTSVVTATTETGQSCSFLVTVNPPVDNEAPTITCPADISVPESSSTSNAANVSYDVTATDNSGSADVTCSPVSGSSFAVGTHEVTCTATDASGNSSSCTFNVTVTDVACALNANSAAPVPNVASLPTITRACSVTLLAADDPTATDACGGIISGDTVDDRTYDAPGNYTVHWTYTDSAGHTTTQNQDIVILPDNTPPVPDAASLPDVTGECSAAITGAPPTATDNCVGAGIVGVPLDPLSYNTVGTHVVRWEFTDNAGNSTIQNQNVVVTDTHAPVVTLNGSASVTVECHTSYTDDGATATDNCSTPPAPTSSSDVNVNVPGTYHVVWSTTDAGGNTGSATRTVTVVDTTKPVITLNGANPLTVILGSTFSDPGATASDSCAGTITPVNASGTVNTNAVGSYTRTYTATDPSGNTQTATRTVNVIYNFTGFFSPVSNPPTLNVVNAGRAIPVKFSLAGNQGLGIFAANSPSSGLVTCGSSAQTDVTETTTAGSSSLSYDAGSQQYNYVWKTESSWAGTCRVLNVTLIDGTTHTALFKFR